MNATEPRSTSSAETQIEVYDLQAGISAALRELDELAGSIAALLNSRQRTHGFLTPQARQIMDRLIRDERAERRGQPDRVDEHGAPVVGLDWLNRTTPVAGTGDVPAPVTIRAAAMDAEITFTLHDLIRRVVRSLARAGVATMHRLGAEPSTSDLLGHLRKLVMSAPSPKLLGSVLRDLEVLREAASLIVDGAGREALPDPCPWCGRRTLVVDYDDWTIRCDRDPKTGHYAPCRCPFSWCDCKRAPVSFRHTWYRERGTAADGIWALQRLLETNRADGANQ